MSIYMVSYRLKKPGKDHEALVSKIKQIGSPWWQDLESTWLIGHLGNASTIRDVLKVYLEEGDELLVVRITKKDAAWSGFSAMGSEWLMRNLS